MRLLKISYHPDDGLGTVGLEFSVNGIRAIINLPMPGGWDEMTRAQKVTWAKQEIAGHLQQFNYVAPDTVVFPDASAQETAADNFEALPGWATWSAVEAENWIEANVTTLATARTALKAMAKAIVYLRDRTIER